MNKVMSRKMKHFVATLLSTAALLWLLSCSSVAGEGHRIRIELGSLSDSELLLAYHYGNRQYIKDTVPVDASGHAVFEGDQRLNPGLYLVVLEDESNFEVIIDGDQHFDIHVDPADLVGSAQFSGSPDNEAFYDYIRFLAGKGSQRQALEQELRSGNASPARQTEIQLVIEEMDAEVRGKQDSIIGSAPGSLLAAILRAQRDPDMPEPPLLPDGRQDIDAMYQLYKSRFFDNIDFSDARLVYTPVYHSRLRIFFNNVIVQHPDSVIQEVDRVLDLAQDNDDVYRYTLWFLTNNAETSRVMGMDKVFVHLVDKYYVAEKPEWVTENRLQRLQARADELRNLLIGKKAPDIRIYDPEGNQVRLHELQADYLVVYFWDSECYFCRQATPKIREAYENLKEHNIKVFAVNTETDTDKWLRAIGDHPGSWVQGHDVTNRSRFRETYAIYAIPEIYILDKDKKILAKGIGAEHLENFLRHEMGNR